MAQQGITPSDRYENEDSAPEHFADAVRVDTTAFGVTLTFGTGQRHASPKAEARIRMSPALAKVMTLLLRQHIRLYENKMGNLRIPDDVAKSLGLEMTNVP